MISINILYQKKLNVLEAYIRMFALRCYCFHRHFTQPLKPDDRKGKTTLSNLPVTYTHKKYRNWKLFKYITLASYITCLHCKGYKMFFK